VLDIPVLDIPVLDNPVLDNPVLDNPVLDNRYPTLPTDRDRSRPRGLGPCRPGGQSVGV